MASATAPLAETVRRLAALDPWFDADVVRPDGAGWHRLDDLATAAPLAAWVDDLAARHDGRRDVAGSYLGSWLAGAAIIVPVASLVLERRVPDPDGPLWIRRHDEGWFDRVAFERPGVLVTNDDPATAHPDATVVQPGELSAALAAGLATRITPVLDAVRTLTPFGRRGLWGGVADELASAALWAARAGGAEQGAAWALAEAVTDHLRAQVRWLRARPRPFPVNDRRRHGAVHGQEHMLPLLQDPAAPTRTLR